MFDTVSGLPIHALIVHATVVLVPLMALLTVLVAVRPRLRATYAWWVLGGDVLLLPLVYATTQSGQQLEDHLGSNPAIERHADLGGQLIYFVLALVVTALIVAVTKGRAGLPSAGGTVLTVVAAVLVLIWVVRIGHAGAEAAWSGLPPKRG